jgi:hypothetical protein
MKQFRDLAVGQLFDWIDRDSTPAYNSFFDLCKKISARKYVSVDSGRICTVGTIKAKVYPR